LQPTEIGQVGVAVAVGVAFGKGELDHVHGRAVVEREPRGRTIRNRPGRHDLDFIRTTT
jgi:hypothetical protein